MQSGLVSSPASIGGLIVAIVAAGAVSAGIGMTTMNTMSKMEDMASQRYQQIQDAQAAEKQAKQEEEAKAEAAAANPLGNMNLLILDADQLQEVLSSNRSAIKDLAESYGYEVTETPQSKASEDIPVTISKNSGSADSSSSSSDVVERYVPSQKVVHDITWGDTLSAISREYGVSVDAIATANGIWDVDLIYDGSSIIIPQQ